jgi:hypothetical protein
LKNLQLQLPLCLDNVKTVKNVLVVDKISESKDNIIKEETIFLNKKLKSYESEDCLSENPILLFIYSI